MKIESYKKDGRTFYRFRAFLGVDHDTGKQIRIHRSGFVTKLEAEKEYIRLKGEPIANKNQVPTFEKTFYSLLELKKISCKESYIVKMNAYYKNHFKDSLGSIMLSDITSEQLQNIIINMNKKMTTANKVFGLVEQVFHFAYKSKLIQENPCHFITKPKIAKKPPSENYYTKDELIDFLEKAKRDLPLMWYVFFHLLAYTGLRKGEALALKWEDLKC